MIGKLTRSIRAWLLRIRYANLNWPAQMTIGRQVRFHVTDGGKLTLSEYLGVADFSHIFVKRGHLAIGSRVHLGIGTIIACRNQITIGDDTLIAEYVTIRDQDHLYGGGLVTAHSGFATAPIVIGDNVWIGAKVTITKGVTIGSNAVIGANSVVTTNIPADVVAAGVPARVIREIGTGARAMRDAERHGGGHSVMES